MIWSNKKLILRTMVIFLLIAFFLFIEQESDGYSEFFSAFTTDFIKLSLMCAFFCGCLLIFGYIAHRTNLSKVKFANLFSVLFSKKHQEEMLLVKKLKEEGIITQEEYDKKISLLKEKSGF